MVKKESFQNRGWVKAKAVRGGLQAVSIPAPPKNLIVHIIPHRVKTCTCLTKTDDRQQFTIEIFSFKVF